MRHALRAGPQKAMLQGQQGRERGAAVRSARPGRRAGNAMIRSLRVLCDEMRAVAAGKRQASPLPARGRDTAAKELRAEQAMMRLEAGIHPGRGRPAPCRGYRKGR